ncbi:MAG TPA: secondary thiamine-phosphate synthase enzyme YjbQ [Methanothrix sp.]|nr:secondary thiamine-phosphate synthase enzyme YjbQ [Methanothrix sp.]HOK58195.1 secondary thiamine-phosphate synthase enzyme YjbQ [Methanothrix sp.]HOL43519.1 secondary thiamine-phosphate synthase enzyme YjbQ [Methanothrix sp.]HPO88606.1 secondary thiamine-phosphate synthase enzyme YjbQ [Methanothrix sp.]
MIETRYIEFETKGDADVVDITQLVVNVVMSTELRDGIVVVFVPGATGAVTTIEYEPGLVGDMRRALDKIAPEDEEYEHNRRWGDGNGHSHIRASLIGPSLTVPVMNGELTLGRWQQIVFIDMDNRPRRRRLVVQIVGETRSDR